MAGWGSFHRFKDKPCVVCGEPYTPASGAQRFCGPVCAKRRAQAYVSTDRQYDRISGNWRKYYGRLLNYRGKVGFGVRKSAGLSIAVVMGLHEKQQGRCALSGVPMTCVLKRGIRVWTNASIDRVDHTGTYTLDNIQLVCTSINGYKHQLRQFEFVWWCCQVAKHSGKTIPSEFSAALVEGTGAYDHG